MCSRPITQDGNTFACRSCDECIAVRRSGWVARAMAEKATSKHAICVTLTYGEETQEQRDAAKMFAYVDVRKFIHRLTSACRFMARKQRLNQMPRVRFICAGEQGDRNGRCHWHIIIYSDLDLTSVGKFTLRGREITDPAKMWTVGKRKRRLHWSMWSNGSAPLGYVTLQQPDEGAMHYVLSYCLKDQFTVEKSRDTGRMTTAENFATGLFKMSKKPPIGSEWLIAMLEELEKKHAVLPSVNLKVPEMGGYWYPGGLFREKLLWHLVALNQRAVWATGANAPQWSSLLASCADNEKDMGILQYVDEEKEEYETLVSDLAAIQRQAAGQFRRNQIIRTCGRIRPCRSCLHNLSQGVLDTLGLQRVEPEDGGEWEYRETVGGDAHHGPGAGINPYCQKRGTRDARLAFPRSGGEAP